MALAPIWLTGIAETWDLSHAILVCFVLQGTASQAIHRAPQLQPQPQPGTAHMHLIGEVTGALGLGSEPLYCTWQLVYDTELWSVLRGTDKASRAGSGSSQTSVSITRRGLFSSAPRSVFVSVSLSLIRL